VSIHFNDERWEKVRRDARLWWEGKLNRPLLCFTQSGQPADRPPAAHPFRHFTAHYDGSVSAEEIVDAWDYALATRRYFGDGFPIAWPNFGPGAAAAFLGAETHVDRNTVWFHPRERVPVSELRLSIDFEHPWVRRIADIYQAAMARWGGQVLLGMTDLGGAVDILATFRPSEDLLFDLYDDPEAVKQRTWEIHEQWWAAFDHFSSLLGPANPGCSGWSTFYSEDTHYMLQCDFCYMIGPEMFDEFVKPELAASCRRLKNAFYHLDGPGQLPHLDSLLAIPELKGIQWVPGDGQPDVAHWPEVYRKIRAAGKLIQVFSGQYRGGLEIIDVLADQLGSAEGIVVVGGVAPGQEEQAQALLRKYGVA
jgi:5-methyltetrahydrofolate--homocysteine methyltransferase